METAAVIREAIALADELDAIRFACGDACVDHVKRALTNPQVIRWDDAVSAAMSEWNATHSQFLPDFA